MRTETGSTHGNPASKPVKNRRTQAQRRSESHQLILQAAIELFGEQGYFHTSLEQIAERANLTTRPIYHYFGSKEALFGAASDVMAARVQSDHPILNLYDNWQSFLQLCDDLHFRQILLIDAPVVLGKERWMCSNVVTQTQGLFTHNPDKPRFQKRLMARMVITALAEAALMIGEADDISQAKREADQLVRHLLALLINDGWLSTK